MARPVRLEVAGGLLPAVTQRWRYNGLGLVAHHYHSRPGGVSPFVVSVGYDAGLPVTQYVNGIPMVKQVTYQPSGALASYRTGINVGGYVTTTVSQDLSQLPRPRQISTAGASLNFDTGIYTYEGAGNIKAMGPDGFSYDPRSRLTFASLSGIGTQGYSYDQYGNLLTKGAITFCSGTCTNNQIPGRTYDARGNLTVNGSDGYGYDGLDRMRYHSSTGTWNYLYDGENERLVKIPPVGDWTYMFRDEGKRISSEYAGPVQSRDNVFLGNQIVASYANGSVGGNGPVWTFYSSDHLGSPRLITDVTGAMKDTPRYWPYGEDTTAPGIFQRVRFAAMEKDTESASPGGSRYYDHARSHEFNLGRFLSPDKIGGKLLRPQSWNRYTYAGNNPLKNVDPNGLEEMTFIFRAFIQKETVFGGRVFRGDDRSFSLQGNRSFRTEQIVVVETDPSKRANPLIAAKSMVGQTKDAIFGGTAYAKGNSGRDEMNLNVSRSENGSVVIKYEQNVHNPMVPVGPGIRLDATVTVDPSGNNLTATGTTGKSPSFEINAYTEAGTSFSLLQSSETTPFAPGLFQNQTFTSICANANSNPTCQQSPAPK